MDERGVTVHRTEWAGAQVAEGSGPGWQPSQAHTLIAVRTQEDRRVAKGLTLSSPCPQNPVLSRLE